jgi:hypothetical protein
MTFLVVLSVMLLWLSVICVLGLRRLQVTVESLHQTFTSEHQLAVLQRIQQLLDEYDELPYFEGNAEATLHEIQATLEEG